MTIQEAIEERHSVRCYDGKALAESDGRNIADIIVAATNPFGGSVTMRMKDFDLHGPQRPGTYGTISGVCTYLLTASGDSENDALATGYEMEGVILAATRLGVSSCWIGGTLSRGDFDRGQSWPAGQTLRLISPLGYAARTQNLRSRLTSLAIGSRKRKAFEALFTVEGTASKEIRAALELMRLAPSSVNSQPWRAIVGTDGTVHFYNAGKKPLNTVDLGIGLYHFHAGMGFRGIFGAATHPEMKNCRYVTSFTNY